MRSLPFFIGLRYTRAKRRNGFVSFISLASMLGIALGITALITVMSVMNGFQKEVRAGMISVASHIQILNFEKGLADWPKLLAETRAQKDVIGVAPFVNGQGLLSIGQSVRGVGVRGIDPELEASVSDIGIKMRIGKTNDLRPGEYGIVLGSYLARALMVNVGDRIQLITPQGSMTPAGMQPRLRSFTVVGVFSSGHYEYDLNLALIHLRDAQVLFRLEDNVTGLRVKVEDVNEARSIARRLQDNLKVDGVVQDWTVENATYFRAVEIEKRMMFIILTLIIAVAAFNLVSTLVMVVRDKHPDIAILRTLGASPGMIMRVFVVQGALVGAIGTMLGVVGGVLLALNVGAIVSAVESAFGFRVLSPEIYFLSSLPSDLRWADVWVTAVIALVLALVATLYPSWRASKVNPVDALRYD
ncbi:MAG: lipoprotein-releasing ABC transporter permease subunit [Betaproteobacteria bacterium]|nr:lipoprotein-releasing ABC transporter permease subunit [Betaproteobacteria bacterium]